MTEPPIGAAVGFVGVGTMGWPMAANLTKAGHRVRVFDLDRSRAERFAAGHGAEAAGTLAVLGPAVDIVVTMLPTGQNVREVMLEMENGGLARHLRPGALLIDMSSSDPIGTRTLGEDLKARGIAFVDAPVSGAVPRARDGTLTIMIGGDDAGAIERAKPVFSAMGNRLFEVGPLGAGHAMKALNNYVAAAGFAAAAEALIVGERFGLEPEVMVDVMNVSTGRNFSTESTIKSQVLTGAYASGFALGLLAKDVRIAADLAAGLGLDRPLVQATNRLWSEARDDLGGGKDHTEAIASWRARDG